MKGVRKDGMKKTGSKGDEERKGRMKEHSRRK